MGSTLGIGESDSFSGPTIGKVNTMKGFNQPQTETNASLIERFRAFRVALEAATANGIGYVACYFNGLYHESELGAGEAIKAVAKILAADARDGATLLLVEAGHDIARFNWTAEGRAAMKAEGGEIRQLALDVATFEVQTSKVKKIFGAWEADKVSDDLLEAVCDSVPGAFTEAWERAKGEGDGPDYGAAAEAKRLATILKRHADDPKALRKILAAGIKEAGVSLEVAPKL